MIGDHGLGLVTALETISERARSAAAEVAERLPSLQDLEIQLGARAADLDEREAEVADREAALRRQVADLDEQAKELDEREADLGARQAALAVAAPAASAVAAAPAVPVVDPAGLTKAERYNLARWPEMAPRHLVALVTEGAQGVQRRHRLAVDGMAGPLTLAALERDLAEARDQVALLRERRAAGLAHIDLNTDLEVPDEGEGALEIGGDIIPTQLLAVVALGLREHQRLVLEPVAGNARGAAIINRYIRETWPWLAEYVKNGQVAWCGHFVAWLLKQLGAIKNLWFNAAISCRRLDAWGGRTRSVPLEQVRKGDILTTGSVDGTKPAYGSHIVLATDVDADWIYTVEGNAYGDLPNGQRGEGVVRDRYPRDTSRLPADRYRPLRCYRLTAADFGGA